MNQTRQLHKYSVANCLLGKTMTDNRMFGGPAMVSVGVRWCSGQYNEGDVVILDKETALEIAVCAEVSNAFFLVGRSCHP